jgi:hypothetical protein
MQVAAIALQVRTNLLVRHQVDVVQALLVGLTQVLEGLAGRKHGSGGLVGGGRCCARRHRQLALQVLPLCLAVLRDGKPAVYIKHIGDVRYGEQRAGQRVVLRLLGVLVVMRNAPGSLFALITRD